MVTLKDILVKFLKTEKKLKYPTIEATILHINPLQVTDDNLFYIDISSLQEEVWQHLRGDSAGNYRLVLTDWEFIFRRVPNSQEFYFDIRAERYKLIAEEESFFPKSLPKKLADHPQIMKLFEEKKKRVVGSAIKRSIEKSGGRSSASSKVKPSSKRSSRSVKRRGDKSTAERRSRIRVAPEPIDIIIPEKEEEEEKNFGELSVAGTEIMEVDDLLSVKDAEEKDLEQLQYEDEMYEVRSGFSRDSAPISGKVSRSRSRTQDKRRGKLSAPAPAPPPVPSKILRQAEFFAPENHFNAQDLIPRRGVEFEPTIDDLLPNSKALHPKQRISFDELRQHIADENLSWNDLKFSKEHLNWIMKNKLIPTAPASTKKTRTRRRKGER